MKTWLRLTLITLTVGGGFTGVAIALQAFLSPHNQTASSEIISAAFLVLYAFVTIAGLLFVQDPRQTLPVLIALILQIPWISSPLLAYRFTAGFLISVGQSGGRLGAGCFLGSNFQFSILQRLPFGAGVNLFALLMVILLVRSMRISPQATLPSTGGATVGAPPPSVPLCGYCGRENPLESSHCSGCGNELERPVAAVRE